MPVAPASPYVKLEDALPYGYLGSDGDDDTVVTTTVALVIHAKQQRAVAELERRGADCNTRLRERTLWGRA